MGILDMLGLTGYKFVKRIDDDNSIEFFLHMKVGRGGTKLYYFDKKPKDAISVPSGYEVVENRANGQPILKKLRR